jgi:hypothetical protein
VGDLSRAGAAAAGLARAAVAMKKGRSSVLKKEKQKTFDNGREPRRQRTPTRKSSLVLSFKKEHFP